MSIPLPKTLHSPEFTTNSVCVTLPTFSSTQRNQKPIGGPAIPHYSRITLLFVHLQFITALEPSTRSQIQITPRRARPCRALLAGLRQSGLLQQSMSLRGRESVAPCSDSSDGVIVDVAAR